MWVRSAFWMGRPKDDEAFRLTVEHELIPSIRGLPGVQRAEALWPRRVEPGAPSIHCQFVLEFRTPEDLDAMLQSPERAASRARVLEIVASFDGSVSHIDFEMS